MDKIKNLFKKIGEILLLALITIGAILVVLIIFALPVMLLWNWLLPSIFNLRSINFFEALGIIALAALLFSPTSIFENKKERGR